MFYSESHTILHKITANLINNLFPMSFFTYFHEKLYLFDFDCCSNRSDFILRILYVLYESTNTNAKIKKFIVERTQMT